MSLVALIRNVPSPNFDREEIPVSFLVIHYTACSLKRTLEIFSDRSKKVCAHFVIDSDGSIYDLGNFWRGGIRRGAHAGISHFEMYGHSYDQFNDFSIGIELVNFNGNWLDFSHGQYLALVKVIKHLRLRFPMLDDPNRIVGHEQIAGFRGKIDPGSHFDWKKLFEMAYPGHAVPIRLAVLTENLKKQFESLHGEVNPASLSDDAWTTVSSKLEGFIKEKNAKQT